MRIGTLLYTCAVIASTVLMVGVLHTQTFGFKAYTYEAARRASVGAESVVLSNWRLQDESGEVLELADLDDQLLLVDFIFTRCPTICRSLGSRYQKLQKLIEVSANPHVRLLSISIDIDYDSPQRLTVYRTRHRGNVDTWHIVRPENESELQRIVSELRLRVIPDGNGGFSHSDDIHIVHDGMLVAIEPWESDAVEAIVVDSSKT